MLFENPALVLKEQTDFDIVESWTVWGESSSHEALVFFVAKQKGGIELGAALVYVIEDDVPGLDACECEIVDTHEQLVKAINKYGPAEVKERAETTRLMYPC